MIEIFEPFVSIFKLIIHLFKISPMIMTIFFSWVIYMNIWILVYNKSLVELVSFGFIKKGVGE